MIAVSGPDKRDAVAMTFALHTSGLSILGSEPAPSLDAAESVDPTSEHSRYYQDPLYDGVFFETNPHGRRYLMPAATSRLGVLMSPEGVTRSDPAYLDQVLVVVRSWRSHAEPMRWLAAIYEQLADSLLRRYPT